MTAIIEPGPNQLPTNSLTAQPPTSVVPKPGLGYGHELYFILDDVGNILEGSFLDRLAYNGYVSHIAAWELADIDELEPVGP